MKKFCLIALAAVFGLTFSTGDLFAQSQPSSKATAVVGEISYLSSLAGQDNAGDGWTTIMAQTIKTPSQAGLFGDVSLESGLYTRTLVRSKGGDKDTSIAEAAVKVRVLCNGEIAAPGEIVFSSRAQTLSAVFQGLLEDEDGNSCLLADLETGNVIIDEDCLQPEEVELILATMSANSFNFVLGNLTSDVYLIEVQAKIEFGTSVEAGEAEASATIGHGSVTVDEIRFIKDEDYNP